MMAVVHGTQAEAEAASDEIGKMCDQGTMQPSWFMDYPSLYVQHGRTELALRLLPRCFNLRTEPPFYDQMLLNPHLASVRGDPRFAKVLDATRHLFEESMAVARAARERGEFPKYLEKPLDELLKKLGMQQYLTAAVR